MTDPAWPDLQAFLAVARTGSLAAAAAHLGTSAPTLGRRIQALEDQLGLRLFTKGTAGYRLTEPGEQLLKSAEAVEQTVLAFIRHRDALTQDVAGTVRVAAPETIITHFLAPNLPELHTRFPRLSLAFTTGAALVNLPRREADIGIRIGQPGEDQLLARKIGEIAFRAYAPRVSSIVAKSKCDLRTVPWIGWGEEFATLAIARTAYEVFDPARQISGASTMQLQLSLAKQLGAALLAPDFVGRADPDLCEVLDITFLVQPLWLVSSAESRGSARAEAVIAWIVSSVRSLNH